jgi:serine/threonine protein kinase
MYSLGERLGTGSYGEVYSVSRESDTEKKKYALKISYAIGTKEKIPGTIHLKEVDLMKRIVHHSILGIHEVYYDMPFEKLPDTFKFKVRGLQDGILPPDPNKVDNIFILTPIALGDAHYFSKSNSILPGHLKRVVMQICQGIQFLHAHGIAHRDLKLGNVLFFFDEKHKNLLNGKICDFGMCKRLDQENNSTYVGTPSHKAPELFLGTGKYEISSDIWSLAILIYEMFTGMSLFVGDNDLQILKKIFNHRGKPDRETFNYLCEGKPSMIKYSSLAGKGRPVYFDPDIQLIREFEYRSIDSIPNFGKLEELSQLLDQMLSLDPRKRPTIVEVLESSFFSSVPKGPSYGASAASQKELDKWYGLCHELPPAVNCHVLEKIKNAEIRKTGIDLLVQMEVNFAKRDVVWKIHFLGLDIYDRCLLKIEEKNEKLSSSNIGLLAICSCYLASKLFLDDDSVHPSQMFKNIRFGEGGYTDAKIVEMEKKILENYLNWKIYRITIYELLKKKISVVSLMHHLAYRNEFYFNGPIDQVAKYYEMHRDEEIAAGRGDKMP